MNGRWRLGGFEIRTMVLAVAVGLFCLNPSCLSLSLNNEGFALLRFRERIMGDPFGALSDWNDNTGAFDPCSWYGVKCLDGKVVILNLKDLCLGGTLAPELADLVYIKSIILRNNSLSGYIPNEIGALRELEVLDLGYNNFSGPFLLDIGNTLSLTTLFLDNNKFLGSISPQLYQLKTLSEFQRDENQLTRAVLGASCGRKCINWNTMKYEDGSYRRQMQMVVAKNQPNDNQKGSGLSPSSSPFSPLPLPAPSPSPSQLASPALSPSESPIASSPSTIEEPTAASPAPAIPPTVISARPYPHPALTPSLVLNPRQGGDNLSVSNHHHTIQILAGVGGGFLLALILAFGIVVIRRSKVGTVKPWATGLSGQLQKAFVTGVPKLKRSELEAACEDFSNIIGSLSDGVVYKGTLSSGVEIAVTSTAVKSTEEWSKTLEMQFRKKIATLSKVNHKNFVNLIGYCKEDQPFTRMMVFEYAPNGTLFEHLHIKEAEHLDWAMRLRIAMGMAYCLEHMHQLNPPVVHENLQSSSVYLTEDYAAKLSDFSFWDDVTAAKKGSASTELLQTTSADTASNVYSFGVILLETITGRIPLSVDDRSVSVLETDYLNREQSLIEMVDPTLKSFQEDEVEKLLKVIKSCVNPDPSQRPTMKEVADRLKDITTMGPDGATPKLSPLWWAELEIISAEAS